ncbi:hypothetical protein LOTGIDRAFT_160958 [Lottia gigantea]|uniref:Uncharacterized protein n=1 Tax=Lottia gigantea TaxID=225164 RepID=V4AHP5_LOTGI|nr:hypothetical protein LOTGIDRAFT_160958 [Lottia gigantea]ESO94725.1 hypothetical protein LOTGIDRAFT_160958 [Lottia gigantea]
MTLKNKLVELEEEKGHLQLKLVDYDEQKSVQAQLEVKLSHLLEEKEKLSSEIRELQSNLHVTNDEREKLSQIVTDLQCSVDENQVQHDLSQSGLITSLQQEVEKIRAKKDQLEKDVDEGRCKIIKLEEENKANQENKLQKETDIIQELETSLENSETELTSLKQEYSELKAKSENLKRDKFESIKLKMTFKKLFAFINITQFSQED